MNQSIGPDVGSSRSSPLSPSVLRQRVPLPIAVRDNSLVRLCNVLLYDGKFLMKYLPRSFLHINDIDTLMRINEDFWYEVWIRYGDHSLLSRYDPEDLPDDPFEEVVVDCYRIPSGVITFPEYLDPGDFREVDNKMELFEMTRGMVQVYNWMRACEVPPDIVSLDDALKTLRLKGKIGMVASLYFFRLVQYHGECCGPRCLMIKNFLAYVGHVSRIKGFEHLQRRL